MAEDKLKPADKIDNLAGERVFVDVDTKDEDVIRYDREGRFIIFDTDRFKELDEGTIRNLSKVTKTAYFVSKAIRDNHGSIAYGDDGIIGQGGDISEQFGNVELKRNDLVYRYSRPDNRYKREQKGWKVATRDDVKFASSKIVEGHFETKDSKTGETDQILMVMPRERYERILAENIERRNKISEGIIPGAADEASERTGYRVKPIQE